MIHYIIKDRPTRLFLILGGFFVANAVIAEVIGVKIFSLEETFGFHKVDFTLFGQSGLSFDLSVGVLPWPAVFILTDIINEYYGVKGVRFLSFLTAGFICMAFVIFYLSIHAAPATWWLSSQQSKGVPDMQAAFTQILGQGMNIIVASLTAFVVGQIADATVFKSIKKVTGEKHIWMRATLSTLISQFIDTIVVSYLYLYYSQGFPFARVTGIALVGYTYKFVIAIVSTPVIYLVHGWIERYLGHAKAAEMKVAAMRKG
jgi:hypothetical protein